MDCPLPFRFRSQGFSPLSGFLASSSLRPYCMPLPFLGFVLLQRFPFTGIAYLSRGRWLPCSYQPTSQTRYSRPCCLRFLRRLGESPFAWFPRRLWDFFPQASLLPVVPGSRIPELPVESASPASKLCSSYESVLTSGMFPPTGGRSSLGFSSSLEHSPLEPRVLGPIQQKLDLCTAPR